MVLSWCRSQLNCTAVRLVPRANPVHFFSLRLRGRWRREAFGLWPFGTTWTVWGRGGTGYHRSVSRSDLGAPLMGVDLRCLQRKRQTRKWCGFAVHSYCCLFPVWSVLAAPAFSTRDEPHPIDSLACLLLLVTVYGTGLYWFADMF